MAGRRLLDDQRLAFGRVADLYDRARPSYPDAVVDELLEFAKLRPPATILEVGAGTGKATVLLAERGFAVLGLEPSHAMASLARAKCAKYPDVEIVETEFERWHPREQLPALVCAGAWHWISPALRYQLACAALVRGGTLAAIWTLPDWKRCPLRAPLSDAYRRAAPELAADFPMHPDSQPMRLAGDWCSEISNTEGFTGPVVQVHTWSQQYTGAEYTALLQTHQDHILLEDPQRDALLSSIAQRIDRAGGRLSMPFSTLLCLATRRDDC